MYPNQPTNQSPIDYLNQIAPQQPKAPRFSPMRLVIYAAAALILVLIVSGLISLFSHSDKDDLEHLAARLQTTSTIASSAQTNIDDDNLQSLNVTLQLYLSETNRTISAPLAEENIATASLDSVIVKDENGSQISSRLADAKLNAVFDNTYANEMSYQLSTIINLMEQIYNTTSNKDLKTFLSTASTNLAPIQKQFSTFNSTDS
jgi:hypothetical protein